MDWAPIITAGHGVWQWGVASSNSFAAFSAALPTECKSSLIHSFGICSGARPLIFPTPGFCIFSLAWGWFLVGTLIGILVMLCMYLVIGWLKKIPPATIYTLLNFALENTTNPEKRRLFFFLLNEKESGISRLAASFNVSPEQLIIQSLREDPQDVIARVIKPVPTAAPGIM